MNNPSFLFLLSLVAQSISIPVYAQTSEYNAVYGLAQACYAIRSPGTGRYLSNSNEVFSFNTHNLDVAEHFYFKPSQLGVYLLTGKDGRYLSSLVPLLEGPLDKPILGSEWQVNAVEVSANSFRFGFKNKLTQMPIQYEYKKRVKIWWIFYRWVVRIEQHFELIPRSDCRPYPEITSNVRGNPNLLKGNAASPVRGYVDAHAHITSYEFMGGKVIHGAPFHKYGVPYALDDSNRTHGSNGSLDLIGNIFQHGDPNYTFDTRGWPDFPYWPTQKQLTYSGYYYKWMERAWLSGLRITTTMLVENEVLCNIQSTVNPAAWIGANSCNTMDSIRLQARRLYEMQDYIDAQYGGPGKGFFQIVTSPAQARQVIADGKLAVVMGVEASETLNCGELDFCNVDKVEEGLMELYQLGIRTIFPAHKFDNQLSGAKTEDGFINIGEALSTGHYYETKRCDQNTQGKKLTSGFPIVGEIPLVGNLLGQIGFTPEYEQHDDHCNIRGLTSLGVYLVNRMIDMHMIIDLDHLSAEATYQVLEIVDARDYSGVVSSHSFMHKDKQGRLHKNFQRMLDLGGFAAHYNVRTKDFGHVVGAYLDAVELTNYLPAVGIGTDMSGLGGQPGPKGFDVIEQITYPFTNEFGLSFDRQVSGNRVFDYNGDGMAHYGMLADHIEDVRRFTDTRIYEAVMNSAEAYLQMWERTESNSNSQYINLYTNEFGQSVNATEIDYSSVDGANGNDFIDQIINVVTDEIKEQNETIEQIQDTKQEASSFLDAVVETVESAFHLFW